jgi:L-threonylcarbamoyladenylate synthase
MNSPIPERPNESSIARAATALSVGELVILPTDTVYGLAAAADGPEAVRAIFAAKGRPAKQPLQLLFSVDAHIDEFAELPPAARAIIDGFGPGAWTAIVPCAKGWTSPALAGGDTAGIRIPDHPVVAAVVNALGRPIAATSANRHGNPSPTSCEEAIQEVGERCGVAIDGGPATVGLDSTVIDCTGDTPRILREGAIDRHTVARILGLPTISVVRSVRPDGMR